MLTRRRFLIGSTLAVGGGSVLARALLRTASFTSPFVNVPNAATVEAGVAAEIAANAISVNDGTLREVGTRPASVYNALWTRDHAYTLWHNPGLFSAAQRRQFVTWTLSQRTTGSTPNPDGGTFPADFIADRIAADGTVTYKNTGASTYGVLPLMDGIHMVILALWTDWNLTADLTTFTASQSALDDCLAAIPRSVNGCVWSDPAGPSVDYGFTDAVLKTGDCAYGTALQAWAYKMLDEISAGGSSTAEADTYANLRAHAESGLATLRQGSGWYKGSSGNNSSVDDVWATALIVAESLVTGANQVASAQTIADAYQGATITQFGLVRHLPSPQVWTGTTYGSGVYQNGGYWLTPLWDCVRAVNMVNRNLARTWAAEAMQQLVDEHTTEADWTKVPYEWHNYPGGVGAKGYTPHAALVHRFI